MEGVFLNTPADFWIWIYGGFIVVVCWSLRKEFRSVLCRFIKALFH
jgi:hypothetical protein